MADKLVEEDFDALLIDFSGCGESDDDELTSFNQTNDLASAIEYAVNRSYKSIILFGNSFGTLACMKNYSDQIKTMVLIGALTDKMDYTWSDYYSEDQLMTLEKQGFFYEDTEREHKISRQTLLDFEEVEQDKLKADIKCPVMIIHGNNPSDEEEIILLSHSRNAINKLPEGSALEVIEGGCHGLREHWQEVISLTCSWILKHIS